jgi:hypothetical protein
VSVGGDGNTQISFTSRPDIAKYVSYVLTRLRPEQLKNRGFSIAGDNKVMSGFWNLYILGSSNIQLTTNASLVFQRNIQGV